MKFLKNCLIAAGITALFFSCSKKDTNTKPSTGVLQSNDTTGDCLPVTVNGTYTAGVALNANNYIDVWVNTTSIGSFNIYTDSVNGMSFASSSIETLGATGPNRIRLYSHGTPTTSGLTTFNILYNGSHCTVSIIVNGGTQGSYLVSDTPSFKPQAAASGAYNTGIPLNAGDTVEMLIKVTKPGSVFVTTDTVNGFYYSGTGIYTDTAIHRITLLGSGVPQNPGIINFYALDSRSDSSKFSVTVLPYGGGANAATFTLAGTPNSCAGFSSYGTYTAGVKIQAEDSVTAFVNVTKKGFYSIVTNPSNGVVFNATGYFDTTGQVLVTLRGAGLPSNPGTFYYSPTGDSSTCSFGINYAQGAGIFILGGAPGACSIPVPSNAIYKTDSALTSNSTITIPVTVTTVGAYSITTATVNGMTFSGSGNFPATGAQSITLTGTGTPTSPGITNFSVPSRTGNCAFTINVIPGTAEFTLEVEPYGQCSGSSLNGKYNTGVALTTTNTATVKVNVIYPGPYTLTTDTATDGMIFSSTGSFATTGIQTVVLQGSGKPTLPGLYNLIVYGGMPTNGIPSLCSITVTVNGTPIPPIVPAFSAIINADTSTANTTATKFIHFTSASLTSQGTSAGTLKLGGSSSGGDSIYLSIQTSSSNIATTTYTQSSTNTQVIGYYYNKTVSDAFSGGTAFTGTPISIVITKLTSGEVMGTFTATLKDNNGTGTNISNITSGSFDLPLQ
jgi:hypothetical protein